MKAPNKIYICVNTPPIAFSCSEVPFMNPENNYEYIHKDALLEWAKHGLGKTTKLSEDGKSPTFEGERIVFECLIKKIESL